MIMIILKDYARSGNREDEGITNQSVGFRAPKKKKKEKKFVTDLLSETNKSLQFYQHTISE